MCRYGAGFACPPAQAQSKVKATARRPASREGQAAAGGEGEGEGEGGAAAEEAVEGDPMVEDIELPPPSFLGGALSWAALPASLPQSLAQGESETGCFAAVAM